ncbi:MAG: TonB-dependent receptor [Verrucomicrobiota bacterium]
MICQRFLLPLGCGILTLSPLPSSAADPPTAPVNAPTGTGTPASTRSASPPEALAPVVVTADRLPEDIAKNPFSVTVIERDQLEHSPSARLDDLLRMEIPGFSLFRRSSSRVAHPTTQGVSLRNLGPNGAGRTLVLLDGTPLNDPFSGTVPWQRLAPDSLERVFVTRGGGAGLYGNAALGGTIQMQSREVTATSLEAALEAGNRDSYSQSLYGTLDQESVKLSGFAQHLETGGYPIVRADQRGPVDQSADSSINTFQGRMTWQAAERTRLEFSASVFEEDRNNGTPLTHNDTEGQDFSAALVQDFPEWQAEMKLQGYYQHREFASTFSSVNAGRTLETPALDQFSVPASSAGGSLTWSQRIAEHHRLLAGLDYRWVEGETNERFRYMRNQFTRLREAGGEQSFAGAFLEDTWDLTDKVQVVAGGRMDYVRQFDGRRREHDAQTGQELLSQDYADTDDLETNGRLGLNAQLADTLKARTSISTAFRQPTLNEFYRPFRVGNEITEANAQLDTEHLTVLEAGLDWTPEESLTLGLTGFYNHLRDAVGNVTLGEGPGTFDPGGFVPAGGVLRQRQNIDLIEVLGVETSIHWNPVPEWKLALDYIFSQAEVRRFRQEPGLVGNRLEQSPEHVVTASVMWQPSEHWSFTVQGRFTGSQFEDDQNTLKLDSCITVDAGVDYRINENISLGLRVENLFDTTIETGKTSAGLVNTGAPRLVSVNAHYRF